MVTPVPPAGRTMDLQTYMGPTVTKVILDGLRASKNLMLTTAFLA